MFRNLQSCCCFNIVDFVLKELCLLRISRTFLAEFPELSSVCLNAQDLQITKLRATRHTTVMDQRPHREGMSKR